MNQQDYINQYALPYLQMTSQGDDEQSLRNKELLSNYLDNPAQYADSLMIEAAKSDIINPKKFNVEGFTSNHSIGISPSNDFNFSYRPPSSEVDGSQQGLFNSYKDNLNDNKPAISEKEKDFNLILSEDQQHANEII